MKRRNFIKSLGLLTGAGAVSITIGGIPVKAFANSFLNIQSVNGKILVLIQLQGGNDGLNTVIPYEDSLYYSNRPTLGIPKSNVVKLNELTGFHPNLQSLQPIYDNGKMTIVQAAGYANPNRSHFRATDIWLSASDSSQYLYDGWMGRYLANAYPDYPGIIPTHPMAIQIGSIDSLLLQSPHGGLGISFDSPDKFYQLVNGSIADTDPPPETIAGAELKFLKQIAAEAIEYATVIKDVADSASNQVTYPNTNIGSQLAIIADLIGGGLQTPVYLTTISGFDTHSGQLIDHERLFTQLADAIAAFQSDIEKLGVADKVVIMTFSEFGRRVKENGSGGTDHGTAAPMFIIGNDVNGGIIGSNPDLNDLDSVGDIKYQFDYRQVYASILKNYFGKSDNDVNNVLLGSFDTLPIFNAATTGIKNDIPLTYNLDQNYPNPFNPTTTIEYSIANSQNIILKVYDILGREVATLVNKFQGVGKYKVVFNANNLPSGTYIYRLQTENFTQNKKMQLLK